MAIPVFNAGQILTASELNDAVSAVPNTANIFTEPQVFAEANTYKGPQMFEGAITQVPGAGANNSTPFAQYGDLFSDAIMSGLTTATSSTLSGTLASGDAYVIGQRVVYPGGTYTVAASSTSYLDLSDTGVLTVSTSATVTANSLRLWQVTSSASAITGVTQVALQGSPVIKFKAYANNTEALSDSGTTFLTMDTVVFNPQNQPILQPNGGLIPTILGYYQVSFNASFNSNGSTNTLVSLYKNGAEIIRGFQGSTVYTGAGSGLVYCNGTTDLLQVGVYVDTSGIDNGGGSNDEAMSFISLVGPL